MRKILDYVSGSGIRFCLYTYDSFLFDVPTGIDKDIVRGLKEVGFLLRLVGDWITENYNNHIYTIYKNSVII